MKSIVITVIQKLSFFFFFVNQNNISELLSMYTQTPFEWLDPGPCSLQDISDLT